MQPIWHNSKQTAENHIHQSMSYQPGSHYSVALHGATLACVCAYLAQ